MKALEKQYNDILTPLKDTIPKRLNMHVQKLTRRQSMAIYSVPNQVGILSSFVYLWFILLLIQALASIFSHRWYFQFKLFFLSCHMIFYVFAPFLEQLGMFLNTIKRILDVLHIRVEGILKSWASCMPVVGEKKSLFGEQMNGITVLLRTKYKNYLQATVGKLICNVSSHPLHILS